MIHESRLNITIDFNNWFRKEVCMIYRITPLNRIFELSVGFCACLEHFENNNNINYTD